MNAEKKIEKALTLIREAGLKDDPITPEQAYDAMRNYELGDLAEDIADMIMLVHNIKKVLEVKE